VDYQIILPNSAKLELVNTVSANIKINDVEGDAGISSVSGDIEVTDMAGVSTLKTVSGKITAYGGSFSRVQTVSGEIYLKAVQGEDLFVETVSGRIDVEGEGIIETKTVSGSIRIDGMTIAGAETISGGMDLTPGGFVENVTLESGSGRINLEIPKPANVDLEVNTISGNIRLENGNELKVNEISKRSAVGRIGNGGPSISIKTTSGNAVIK
jgi:DUF4097 and DUF4098 domain-containing protein YvlB